jgi:hypothetical protein
MSKLLLVVSALSTSLLAQNVVVGRVDGTVYDAAGAAVPDAQVTAVDLNRNVKTSTTTTAEGYFRFPRVYPGAYRIEASKSAMRTAVREVTVAVNQALSVDLTLDVEEGRQSVTVSSSAIAVQGQTAETGALINEQQIDMLPLNGRNFQRLLFLTPGVGGFDVFGEAVLNPAVNGTRPAYNNFMVDGIGANDERLATGVAGTINASGTDLGPDVPNVISTEALQEYRVIASNADATFGRGSGAQVNVVTRSGSNDLHGSAYWYVRNDAFDARNFFNYGPFLDSRGRAEVPPFQQNVFGGTIGGPVVRNKHFFFGNYEGFRQRRREQLLSNTVIPNGDLIRLIPGELGRFYQAVYLNSGVLPASGNPAGQFTPLSAAERAAAVAAGFSPALFNGNAADGEAGTVLRASAPKRDVDQNAFLLRTDHVFSEHFSLAARYNQARSDLESGSLDFATFNQGAKRLNFTAMLQGVWTPSAAHIVEVRGGVLRNEFLQFPVGSIAALDALGFRNPSGLQITVAGAPFSTSVGGNFVDHQTTPQASGQHTWVQGRWILRSGADWRSIRINVANFSAATPSYTFEGFIGPNGLLGSAPGQAQAVARSASLGAYGQNGGPQSPMRGYRSHIQEYFSQADWRVSRDLTVNLGIRYAYFGVYNEVNSAISSLYALDSSGQPRPDVAPFTFGRTNTRLLPVGAGRRFYNPDRNNFQPRLGMAWDLGGRHQQVLRAGYGVYHDRLLQVQFTGAVGNPPFSAISNAADVPFTLGLPPINLLSGAPAITGVNPEIRNPYVHRVNAAFEQAVGSLGTITAAYVGAFARGITATVELNGAGGVPGNLRPDPRYTTQNVVQNYGDSTYHAFQLSFQRRFWKGLDLNAFYTRSSYRDDWSRDAFGTAPGLINSGARAEAGFQGGGSQWILRPKGAERGAAEYDIPHNFTISHVWEIPFGRSRAFGNTSPAPINAIFGGWALSGFFTWRSGEPINVTLGRDIDDDGNAVRDRPALATGSLGDLYARGRFDKTVRLLPQAEALTRFVVPTDVTDPRAVIERNQFTSAPVQTYDVSLLKRIGWTERVAASLEANAFNVFNRANFARPGGALSSPLFGVATRTVTPSRQLQFGLKIVF